MDLNDSSHWRSVAGPHLSLDQGSLCFVRQQNFQPVIVQWSSVYVGSLFNAECFFKNCGMATTARSQGQCWEALASCDGLVLVVIKILLDKLV